MYFYLISFFMSLSVVVNGAEDSSPVLLWSPERSMVSLPDVSSIDSFTASSFYSQFLSPLMLNANDNGVIFLQDKLSVDDFTKYADVFSIDSQGGSFKNVKRLMEDHFSLEVPQVNSPHVAVEKLKKNFGGNVHIVNDLPQVEKLDLEGKNPFLLVVNLKSVFGVDDQEKALAENDAVMGKIAQHLHSRGIKYSALFTGKSSQQMADPSEPLESNHHTNRHLLATDVDADSKGCQFLNKTSNDGQLFVFLCGVKVCIVQGADKSRCDVQLNMTITKDDAASSVKKDNTAQLVLEYKDVQSSSGKYDAKFTMDVKLLQDRWVIKRNSLDLTAVSGGSNKTEISNATLVTRGVDTVIPRPYSFHCTKFQLFLETSYDKKHKEYAGTYLILEGFQFQVFDITQNRFFNAQDCVGFFTSAIWMGIVPALFLLVILAWGLNLFLNLSVMDKFDDPKGKTITINVVDE